MVVPLNQLRELDAEIRFQDGDREIILNVSRKRSGLVALTCSCVPGGDWCRHQIDLLTAKPPQGDLACDIEDIYFGTRLAGRAEEVRAAMEHFDCEFCAGALDKPAETVTALDEFAVSAAIMADAARDWRRALDRYLSELRRGLRE